MALFKTRIRGPGPNNSTAFLIFEASVPVSESRQASYTGFDIVHAPTSIQTYKNTSARKFEVTGKLVSRTVSEAQANSYYLDLARSWLLPDFGKTGATPPILKFWAYGNKNIEGLQTILLSYNWTFPDEVDYIVGASQPMPVIGQLTMSLEEVYSPEQISAGAWRLNVAPSGHFAGGNAGPSSSGFGNLGLPGKLQALGLPDLTPSGILGTVGSQIQSSLPPTLAGVIAGKLTRSLGGAIVNSPQVKAVINGVPTFARNIFVTGANAAVGDLGRAATGLVSTATRPAPVAGSSLFLNPLSPENIVKFDPPLILGGGDQDSY
jgi:hypothetical protein